MNICLPDQGYAITTLVTDNITQLLDHRVSSWAVVIFEVKILCKFLYFNITLQWGVALLTAVSRIKFKSGNYGNHCVTNHITSKYRIVFGDVTQKLARNQWCALN